MRFRIVKWLCVAVLFMALCLWQWIADFEFALRIVVCSGAAVVGLQGFQLARYRWMWCFLAIALLFNPALPIPLSGLPGLIAIGISAAAFAVSLNTLKLQPLLSIPSITDRNPGSESL